jgi:hypothetical protein
LFRLLEALGGHDVAGFQRTLELAAVNRQPQSAEKPVESSRLVSLGRLAFEQLLELDEVDEAVRQSADVGIRELLPRTISGRWVTNDSRFVTASHGL